MTYQYLKRGATNKKTTDNDTYNITAVDVDASIQSRCHIGRTTVLTCLDKIVLSVEKGGEWTNKTGDECC